MNYTQQDRAMEVTTPLGKDKLLLVGFTGQESISRLFSFHLDLLAENETDVAFDKLLGQKITVRLDLLDGEKRHFNGICNRISQGERGEIFTQYRMEIVPALWMLTKKAQSRIFQQMSVPGYSQEGTRRARRDLRDPGPVSSARLLRSVPRDGF